MKSGYELMKEKEARKKWEDNIKNEQKKGCFYIFGFLFIIYVLHLIYKDLFG